MLGMNDIVANTVRIGGMITKTLKFNHIEAENIKKGRQTATLRMKDEKDIAVDDKVYIVDKVKESDPKTWRVCGTAVIDQVKIMRVGDLDLDGAHFEQFGSTTELYKQLEVFYGDPIEDNTHVKVISFSYRPFDEEKKLEYIEDKNTTLVTEVKLYGDGGSRGNPGPSASGFVIMDMSDKILETNGEYLHITTNNQAEYHSLKIGLERCQQLGVKIVHVYMDSLLVVNQLKGLFKVRNKELMQAYLNVKSLASGFVQIDFTHVPREYNKLADAEVNRILDSVEN
jgi:ribonuclease HI